MATMLGIPLPNNQLIFGTPLQNDIYFQDTLTVENMATMLGIPLPNNLFIFGTP